MPTEFLLASVGAGKTEAAQVRLISLKEREPFGKVWCLLATERQIFAFRQRLMHRSDAASVYFNIEFFTFYPLYRSILESAGKPQRVLDNAARYRLLRLILMELERDGELELFGRIAGTPGLVRILAEFIYELKQNLIDHNEFGVKAETAKDRDIARIYTRYQELLMRYDLVDREGEGWRALDELEDNHYLGRDIRLLLVDGYDQFNKLQGQLLTLLAGRADQALITLTTVPGREQTIGKRFQRALERLQAYHHQENIVARVRPRLQPASRRNMALNHLVEHILLPRAARAPAGAGVLLLETPDPVNEVAAALRRAKTLLLNGEKPDEVLITVRDWARYGAYFEPLARAYGVPLVLDAGTLLSENPAIYALIALLDLHKTDFRRRELLDTLRSAYIVVPGLGATEADLLERIGLARLVTSGRDAWLAALEPAASGQDEDGEPLDTLLDADTSTRLRTALAAFFDAVTPPEQGHLSDYVTWLEDLIGLDPVANDEDEESQERSSTYTLSLIAQARKPATDSERDRIVGRDLAALHELKCVLRGMLSAHRLFAALEMTEAFGWGAFFNDLQSAIKGTTMARRAGRDGRVLVTTVTDARGLPHRHVIVLGLSEGVFPMRAPEDPLYLDSERRHLAERGIELPLQADRADDDGLFYEMISLATESLTLTRTLYENGAPLPPSHLWSAVEATLSDIPRQTMDLGAVVPAQEAASRQEVALAIADALNRHEAAVAPYHAWYVATNTDAWLRMSHARAVELRRLSRAPHDTYSGRLHHSALIAQAARFFENRLWSATQLNDYGICGFRFFAKRMLKLEPLAEPEDGLNAAQLGTLYHSILEHTYRDLAARGIAITRENMDTALEALERAAEAVLEDAPERIGFRIPALWREERDVLFRRLQALVRDDFDDESSFNEKLRALGIGERRPYRLEAPFGEGGVFALDIGGETLRIRGVIDRIDRTDNQAVVIDYKSGSSEIPVSEIARGRNFQMMIYLLAARAAFAAQAQLPEVTGGVFWHIGTRKTSGLLQSDDNEVIEAGKAHLRDYLARGRRGDFSADANKVENGKCSRYCDYSQLCRFAIVNRGKPHA